MRPGEQVGTERALRVIPSLEPPGRRTAPSATAEAAPLEQSIDVSVLVTVSERPGSLLELYRDFREPLVSAGYRCEFIFLLHPRYRDLAAPLRSEVHPDAVIETVIVGREVGETTLLRMGLARSRGRVLLTLPAYRQVQPSGVAELVAQVDAGPISPSGSAARGRTR